jgi:predicted PurR-regulated permease PerM
MEFFIPSILIFLLAIAVSFVLIPRFTPLIIAILSIGFLAYGVYDHYKMFASEYRLSTWQQSIKIYAPAVMIAAICIFIIYSILALFTKGSVPVPNMPNIKAPEANSLAEGIVNSFNKATSAITNTTNNMLNNINKSINEGNKGNNNKNKNKNNLSRSFLETI